MKQQLSTIASWLHAEGQLLDGIIINGVSIDTRTIQKGDLFIPFRGEQVNGHQFVETAIEKGAVASLWIKDEPNPPTDIPLLFIDNPELALQEMARSYRSSLTCEIIGITGSNGKTSTKDLIASVLTPYFKVQKTEGNLNNELGLPLTILSIKKETEYAVLEMGMSGFGEISFLSKLAQPDYVIITNIGEAHMQDLGSREGIAKAKFEIIEGLTPNGKLFFDGDEPLLISLVNEHPEIQAASFGYGSENALALEAVKSTESGSEFKVSGLLTGEFTIPVYGAHQAKNTLAALLIAHEAEMNPSAMKNALKQAALTPMRMQPVLATNGALIINDAYNAAPTSMRAALSFIQDTNLRHEKWVVLGDMLELGEDEKMYHEIIAEQLIEMKIEGILLYGHRMKWLYDKLQKMSVTARLIWSKDNYEPIKDELRSGTCKDSVILLKGSRGMQLENVLDFPAEGAGK